MAHSVVFKFWGFCTMARDIKLDQIRARLGDLDKPRDYDPYNTDNGQNDFDEARAEESGSSLNAGFFATMVALFVAVSGGTYMFSAGINPMSGTHISWGWKGDKVATLKSSSADGECGKDWMAEHMNGDPMHCYMTKRIGRLCNVEERETFVARVQLFEDDYIAFDNKMLAATMNMAVGTPLADKMQIGLEAAKMDHAATPEEAAIHEQNVMDGVGEMMAGTNAVLKDQKYQNFGHEALTKDLNALGKKGYITLADFPGRPPKWVTAALQKVTATANPCNR